jgi:predicted HicB family RNase H-like nuclease
MKSNKSDKNLTKQVRIDAGLHRLLKLKATNAGVSIKTCLEGYLAELLEVNASG